jgi:hypothetical protein
MATRGFHVALTSMAQIYHFDPNDVNPSPSQGLRVPHVRCLCCLEYLGYQLHWNSGSFLLADSTRGALQVFLPQQFLAVENPGAAIREEGLEEGTWITVEPIPGCIVCNIGESPWILPG